MRHFPSKQLVIFIQKILTNAIAARSSRDGRKHHYLDPDAKQALQQEEKLQNTG